MNAIAHAPRAGDPVATGAATPGRPARSPWPYALVAFFAVFISFIAWFVTLASRQRIDLVRPDYYDQEIRYQQQIDRLNRSARPGMGAAVSLAASSRAIDVAIPAAHAAALEGGTVALYRPSDARLDRTVPLKPGTDGRQSVDAARLDAGLWRVRVSWKSGGAEYFHEATVNLPAPR